MENRLCEGEDGRREIWDESVVVITLEMTRVVAEEVLRRDQIPDVFYFGSKYNSIA